MADRADGYYWVTDGGSVPEVAAWSDGCWWLTGCEEPAAERQIVVLGGCLTPPSGGAGPVG